MVEGFLRGEVCPRLNKGNGERDKDNLMEVAYGFAAKQ